MPFFMSQFLKIGSCCEQRHLNGSVDTDAVLGIIVTKPGKLTFCCLDYGCVSEVSGLCLSVFVTVGQRMLWFTHNHFVCL